MRATAPASGAQPQRHRPVAGGYLILANAPERRRTERLARQDDAAKRPIPRPYFAMSEPRRQTPPLSPVLLVGLALRPMPPVLLQPALTVAMTIIHRRHPAMFERLAELGDTLFLIDPVDLPFVFLLHPDAEAPSLVALGGAGAVEATATIRAPLLSLIDLLEGRIDGDALFFSRDLVIEGETEAVVALRNAVDGAEIDIVADLLSFLGPLARPARFLVRGAGAVFARAAEDLETLRAATIAPAIMRSDALAAELDGLEERLSPPRRRSRRARAKRP